MVIQGKMVVPPGEEQPQMITSSDGKVQIINHSSYFDRFGCYCIEGAVKYIIPEPKPSAEIKADYYGMDRELIDAEAVTVDFQESGKTRSFYVMYCGLRRGEIQYYKVYITAKKRA